MSAPRKVDIAGSHYPLLTVEAFVSLGEDFWLEFRRQMIRDFDDAKIGDAARAEALDRHLNRRGMPGLLGYAAFRIPWALRILKAAGVPDDVAQGLAPGELTEAARALVGMEGDGNGPGKAETTTP